MTPLVPQKTQSFVRGQLPTSDALLLFILSRFAPFRLLLQKFYPLLCLPVLLLKCQEASFSWRNRDRQGQLLNWIIDLLDSSNLFHKFEPCPHKFKDLQQFTKCIIKGKWRDIRRRFLVEQMEFFLKNLKTKSYVLLCSTTAIFFFKASFRKCSCVFRSKIESWNGKVREQFVKKKNESLSMSHFVGSKLLS